MSCPTIWYLAGINLAAFALCGADKCRARKKRWRIPEKALFTAAVLGGSPGLWLGMQLFRHKTRHKSFTIGVPVIFALQCLAAAAIWAVCTGKLG